ncbi:MAG TPA: acylneuraminate cytidylyltransferase [Anaerolineales bacterium]|nr:acylneuraminate cytidylyltransferase [Anaerolineales bacterium]
MKAKRPEVLAIVSARGGSKSIPRKNAKLFLGHPLLAYSIAAGLQAKSVSRVIVSTDDEALAAIAREYGAEAPFLRPAQYAQDDTPDLPVFQHALRWLAENEKYRPDIVVQLRPTSPLRPKGLVDRAVETLMADKEADSVRGVVPAGQNPYKMWTLTNEGTLQPLLKVKGLSEAYNAPRQALPQTYWQTGHVDAIRMATIMKKDSMSGAVIWPVLIDAQYSVDIDTLSDWRRAEWLASKLDLVRPGSDPRPLPKKVKLLVMDFDGVLTDNRVWNDEAGKEQVAANRSDGLGIELLLKAGVNAAVISMEENPVVAARCKKMGIPYKKGIENKGPALQQILAERGVSAGEAVFLGNDTNDLPCFPLVACGVAVADAHPEVLRAADMVLSRRGGQGAVRELCDLILANRSKEIK